LNSLSENRRAACVGQCALAEVGAMLLLFEFLDDYLAREARRLRFDSLQLLQVPQSGYKFFANPHRWTVEIFDLRTATVPTIELEEHAYSLASTPSAKSSAAHIPSTSIPSAFTTLSPTRVEEESHRHSASMLLSHLRAGNVTSAAAEPLRPCEPTCWFKCCMACKASAHALQNCLGDPPLKLLLPRSLFQCRSPSNLSSWTKVPKLSLCASSCNRGSIGTTSEVWTAASFLEGLRSEYQRCGRRRR